jgi:hypothetical protein
LKALVELHSVKALDNLEKFHVEANMGLRGYQTKLIHGAIEINEKSVK